MRLFGKLWDDGDVTLVFANSVQGAAQMLDELSCPISGGIYEIPIEKINGLMLNGVMTIKDWDGNTIKDRPSKEELENFCSTGETFKNIEKKQYFTREFSLVGESVDEDEIEDMIKAGKHRKISAKDIYGE